MINLDIIDKLYLRYRIPLIFILIFIFFHRFFESIITKILVIPFLSTFTPNLVIDILWIVLLVLIVLISVKRHRLKYYIGNGLFIISIIALSIFFCYRINENVWIFYKLPWKTLAYLDIIPFFLLSFIVNFSISKLRIKNEQVTKGFDTDDPLGKKGVDLLNRLALSRYIADKVLETKNSNGSFAIGISSEWGFGKTSFLDLIERGIDKNKNVIIKFNPWACHDRQSIIKDFFNTLDSKLKHYNSDITTYIQDYYEALLNLDENRFNKLIQPFLGLNKNIIETDHEFKAVNKAIENINKKIVIFIDDLDRLYKTEIIEVLKIVRNSANFSNIVFIVSYDRNYIINAIKEVSTYYPEFFLEKIFQIEIQLPNYDISIIKNRLFELLNPILESEDQIILKDILLKKTNSFGAIGHFLEILVTFRDITRFVNSFRISYHFLKGNIVLLDLLNLEALRLKYPGVYKLVFFQPNDFLETKTDGSNKSRLTLRKEKINQNNQEYEITLINEYLKKNYESVSVPLNKIENVINLLNSIFPEPGDIFIKQGNELLSVKNPISFDRYSHYRLLDSDLSEIDFSKSRSSDIKEFQRNITDWSNQKLNNDLRRKLENISSYYDKEDYEKVIRSIFFFAKLPSNTNSMFGGFEYENLYNKISDYDNSISSKYYKNKNELRLFLQSIFETAPSPYTFEAELIFNIFDKQSISYDFIIPKDKLESYRVDYFKKYLNEAHNLDSNVWHLFRLCDIIDAKLREDKAYSINKFINPKASDIYKDVIKNKFLDEFLSANIKKEPFHNDLYAISEFIPKMFGSYEAFGTFLHSFDTSKFKYFNEFMRFYQKFSETNFTKYIKFRFEVIKGDYL